MSVIRVLSFGLLSFSSVMANYDRSLSLNLIDKNGKNHASVDILKMHKSAADKDIIEFAFVNGIAHGINFTQIHCSSFIPVLNSMLKTHYVSNCKNDLLKTKECQIMYDIIQFLDVLPFMLPKLEEHFLKKSTQLRKELPESSQISITFLYNIPDVKVDGKDEIVDTKDVSAEDNK